MLSEEQIRAWHALELGPLYEPKLGEPTTRVEIENQAASPVAAMNWNQLESAVKQCQACGLCASRRNTVFGVGSQRAKWLLIGEAPGEEEDLRGEPFVGPSGQLLDAILRAIGLDREADVFIANVIKCRPPGNRDPLPNEVLQCEPYLKRQIQLLRPQRIVLLGRFAAQSVLNTQATIASLRGQVHQVQLDDEESSSTQKAIPCIVTYHPSYLLRNLEHKNRAWEDWLLAKSLTQELKQ